MKPSVVRNLDLDTALAEARRRYIEANPASQARQEEAQAALPGANTRSVLHYPPFPLGIARGEGASVWDFDGHGYADFLCEYSAGLYGHSNPTIRAAIDGALDDGVVLGGPNRYEGPFAKALTERFPAVDLVRFCNSGTEANMMSLSTACAVTGRTKVLAFEGGYHGGLFEFSHGVSPLNSPLDVVLGRYNDVEGTSRLIELHKHELAAVIIEPMLGGGGCIPADPDFLSSLREATATHGIILIFDEVITSRLGPGGLQGALGVAPDMTSFGKYLGGGVTFGAFGGRRDIMRRFDPSRPDALFHAGTFNNNVLTMAAGLAGLTQVFTPQAAQELSDRGDRLRERMNAAISAHGQPMQVTGQGSVMCVHFTAKPVRSPDDLADEDPRLPALFHLDMLTRGQYLAPRGMLAVSLPMGEAGFDGLVAALGGFLDDYGPLLAP